MFRTRNPNPGTRLPNPGSRIPNPETKNLEAGAERDGGERCHRLRSMLSFVAVLRAYASLLFVSLSALSDFLTVLFVSLTALSACVTHWKQGLSEMLESDATGLLSMTLTVVRLF